MEEIEVVINITKHEWEYLNKLVENGDQLGHYERLLVNGTPLPKGHGRIGDLDALEKDMIGGIKKGNYEEGYAEYFNINNVDDCVDCVRYAVTIIEADKMNKQIRADRE